MAKSEKLSPWELQVIEESLRAYAAPGFSDTAKENIAALIEKISRAKSGRITFFPSN